MRRLNKVVAATGVLAMLGAGAACTPDGQPDATRTVTETATPTGPTQLTLAVYGPPAVTDVYTDLAASFSAANDDVTVSVRPYRTRQQLMEAMSAVQPAAQPDLFLAGEADLPTLVEEERIQPVDQMLVERQVDFGDGYERAGLEAMSGDSRLLCMPVEVSPLVVYYNAALVPVPRLVEPGETAPTSVDGWTFDQFARGALAADGVNRRGVHVEADLAQLAPFLMSAGSDVVDDAVEPTTTTFADDAEEVLPIVDLLRDRRATFSSTQLDRRGALARFKTGELGMIVGERSLTPELRQQQDLRFGVMPIPRDSRRATTARIEGMCASAGADAEGPLGDLLVALTDADAAERLAATGYVVPANSLALRSDSFTQTDQLPTGAASYSGQMRYLRPRPAAATWDELIEATRPGLEALLTDTVIDPLEERLTEIDATSQDVLGTSEEE
ncbi:hypothetical protein GCM10027425_11740 [Alteromonas gracilis]